VIAARLFWRIYVTLLASLVAAAMLMGVLWGFAGETPAEIWARMPVRLLEAALPPTDDPPGVLAATADRLARAVQGDVTVLGPDGRAQAIAGAPLAPTEAGPWHGETGRHVWAFRLHDGRVVLARFGMALRRPSWHVLVSLLLVAVCVGIAALPVVARLTKRLERLRHGVERWGAGDLAARVPVHGQDEIAAVARSFNQAAERIQALLAAHRALLANASHELRSPLARLRVATELMEHGPAPAARAEVSRNLAELDQLIDEILLASRLDHLPPAAHREPVELLALAAEEAARVGASAEGDVVEVPGDPRLLRRMLRNLLENAAKHGAPPVEVVVARSAAGRPIVTVRDRGPGVPAAEREKVFEPFYRPAGHAEAAGGWGLGLALVRQIARRHGGEVRCEARPEGGSVFVVELGAATSPRG
jgi:two-component system OmpR family sensor kinase